MPNFKEGKVTRKIVYIYKSLQIDVIVLITVVTIIIIKYVADLNHDKQQTGIAINTLIKLDHDAIFFFLALFSCYRCKSAMKQSVL